MKYIPLKFHIFYILITLFFSFFGPRVYENYNKLIVLLFIVAYCLIVILGFRVGVKSELYTSGFEVRKYNRIITLVKYCISISVFLCLINIAYLYSQGRLSLSISSLGENYTEFYTYYYEKRTTTLFTFEILFLVVSAIPKFISLALGFIYYKELNKRFKRLFVILVILIVATQTFSIGNQKSIGDIVIFFVIALLIKASDIEKTKRKKIIQKSLLVILSLFVLLSFIQYSRLSSRGITIDDINVYLPSYTKFDENNFVFKMFGPRLGLGVSMFITGYLSGGYYGLSLCLQMPFEWTYGVGNSVTLSTLIEHLYGIDIYSRTYLFRMEETYGVLGKQQWHTIFPWLASDYTFLGTLVLFFLISLLYGRCWREVIEYKNPVSLLLFSLLSILFVFVPANNQILHGFDYFLITFFVLIFWVVFHKKYNYVTD